MSEATGGVIDAHVHLWDTDRLAHPWLSDVEALDRQSTPATLRAATEGTAVTGWVVVEAGVRPDQALAEARWLHGLADAGAPVVAVVAAVAVERADSLTEGLAALRDLPLVTGVRRNMQDEAPGFILRPEVVEGVRRVGEAGLCFDLCVRHHQLAQVRELVRACPGVRFVLDHVGKPDVAAGGQHGWAADLAALAALPQVWCKLSGLTTEADAATRDDATLGGYLRRALDVFGPGRCLFGSDWPVASPTTSYAGWLDTVRAVGDDLSPTERDAVLRGNALAVYGGGASSSQSSSGTSVR